MRNLNKFDHKSLLIGLVAFTLISCVNNQIPFSQKVWNDWDGHYDYRKLVIDDLLKNYLYKGMPYKEVVDLLGKSYSTNDNIYYKDSTIYIEYEVEVEYTFLDIDPVAGSYLQIVFGKDSLITSYEIIKWKAGEK